jgi:cytochrome bd-type quinol oxidase subunit 2
MTPAPAGNAESASGQRQPLTMTRRRLVAGLWAGIAVSVAGRLLDLRWHATHQEFETGADQLQAHWLAWLGALLLLLVAAGAWRSRARLRNRAITLTLAGAVGYGLVAGWHFWEHTRHQEATLTHLLLVVTLLAMLGGAVAALLLARTKTPTPR